MGSALASLGSAAGFKSSQGSPLPLTRPAARCLNSRTRPACFPAFGFAVAFIAVDRAVLRARLLPGGPMPFVMALSKLGSERLHAL